jgi:hypothetical protein
MSISLATKGVISYGSSPGDVIYVDRWHIETPVDVDLEEIAVSVESEELQTFANLTDPEVVIESTADEVAIGPLEDSVTVEV